MSARTLAGQPVEVDVTGADGRPVARTLTEREVGLAERADARLRSEPKLLPAGTLWQRMEVNGALPDHDPAYLYLRYQTPDGDAREFWAGYGPHDAFDARRGLVTVADAAKVSLTKPDLPR